MQCHRASKETSVSISLQFHMAPSSSIRHFPLPSTSIKNSIIAPHASHLAASAAGATTNSETPPKSNSGIKLPPKLSNNLAPLNLSSNCINPLLTETRCDRGTHAYSPREDISSLRDEIHGQADWSRLLDPLHPWLRREVIKYGEFAQATYDAFDFNHFSDFCGSCLYGRPRLFQKLGLSRHHYNVTKYIYAMSHVELPRWMERSFHADSWSKNSNWMGYVAVSDDVESHRIRCRDIVVAWRGTVTPAEWFEDVHGTLEPLGEAHSDARVERGFLSIYTSKSESTRYNKSSASEQVMKEIRSLVNHYREKGEEVNLTITGHSLGGALALLNAYEAASTIPNLPVSVISFGAPRVCNEAFGHRLEELEVKTLRVVVKQDVVPKMPGVLFKEGVKVFEGITGELKWVYTHVGLELGVDVNSSPFLKQGLNLPGFHSLETYLHLVDGYLSRDAGFRRTARRDVALVNKDCGMLKDELRIPACWHQSANKGMVCNAYGRWVQQKREAEDIPSLCGDVHESSFS